jgi:hypothetical protein
MRKPFAAAVPAFDVIAKILIIWLVKIICALAQGDAG